ncbi:NAD(P)H nitroreductase [Otariodibacter oris]|uniref:Putative NAD(P)H nitroreductase n=1 Tax=Otariodibacter oris TaxID=1032623 RepID=A0A420XI39_9PAST|nr:NAD(P)H nitroreductase [Otariodibacter oris]QGM81009.1 nitroreductase [Otariodibacter oris]RKR76811.1 nitroreductase [Otariodibacter oris]
MEVLNLLQHRRSSKKFSDIAPTKEQLEIILKSALRAPDHGRLKPYHFVVIEKESMALFEKHLKSAAIEFKLGNEILAKAEKISQRAPMIIGVVAKITKDIEKVPAWEQMLTAGCATYAMQLAANAQGFETCWISNKWIDGSDLRKAFNCQESDKIIGLVMIGSPADSESITLASHTDDTTPFVSYLK